MIELTVILLAFIQNVAFTMVSRARNRDSMAYHAVCSVFSNGIWLLTMGFLINELIQVNYWIALPYIVGTVSGSLFGAKASMRVEKWLGTST